MPTLLSSFRDDYFLANHRISSLACTADSRYVVTYSDHITDGYFELFELATGERKAVLPVHFWALHLRLRPNPVTGQLFYWERDEGRNELNKYHLYELSSDGRSLALAQSARSFITDGYFSDVVLDEAALYVASTEGFQLRDAADDTVLREIRSPFGGDNSDGLAISPDRQLVAFGSYKTNDVAVYRIATGQQIRAFRVNKLHDQWGAHLEFAANDVLMAGAGSGPTVVEFWDARAGTRLASIHEPARNALHSYALSPDGQCLALPVDGGLNLYRTDTCERLWQNEKTYTAHPCFTPDGRFVAAATGQRIVLYDRRTGTLQHHSTSLNADIAEALYVLPGGGLLGCRDAQAVPLNAATGQAGPAVPVAANCRFLTYDERAAPNAPNLAGVSWDGLLVGSVAQGLTQQVVAGDHCAVALSGWALAACGRPTAPKGKNGLYAYAPDGSNPVLLTTKNLPTVGLAFLGEGPLLAGIGEGMAAVWNVAEPGQCWQVELRGPLKVGYHGRLATHESGTHVFVRTAQHKLLCLAADGQLLWKYEPRREKSRSQVEVRGIFGRGHSVLCLMSSGELLHLDLHTGTVLHRELLHPRGSKRAALAPDNTLYVVHTDTSLAHYDAQDWLAHDGTLPAAPERSPKKGK